MAMSGVSIRQEVIDKYNTCMKITKDGTNKLGCMFLKLSDDLKEVILEKEYDADQLSFEDLKAQLPKDEGRYILYDYSYETKNGMSNKKVILIAWSPDCAPLKKKMLYASSKDAVKKVLTAVAFDLQANDLSDLDKEEIDAKLRK